jgi:hypothetical protein
MHSPDLLHNVGGNGAAAKALCFQNSRHRQLPFTALICEFCGLQDGLSEQIGERVDARILERRFDVRSVSGTAF